VDIQQVAQAYINSAYPLRVVLKIPREVPILLETIGHGEYNDNYRFVHPISGSEYVLRINYGSQMHLDHQIAYEFGALKLLEPSNRTPQAHYFDDSPATPGNGVLVEEFHRGRPLRYETDLARAATILADIHAVAPQQEHHLVRPAHPLGEIVDESQRLFAHYETSSVADKAVVGAIRTLFAQARKIVIDVEAAGQSPLPDIQSRRCIINTELNSSNFLMVDEDYTKDTLVDWEKPIWGESAQDIADFLAPTTTFWKTDTLLSRSQMNGFIAAYRTAVAGRFETAHIDEIFSAYLSITCLRGVAWCAMAFVEYQGCNRALQDRNTFEKIKAYLDPSFIEMIRAEWYC
jgi:hypothetical protein